MPEPAQRSEQPGWAGVAVTAAGIALAAGLIFAVPELRHAATSAISGDTTAVRSEVDNLGWTGPLIVLALALIHAVVFYPAEILDTAAGFAYGFWWALPLVMLGWVLSAMVAYEIGRAAARPILYRLAGEERFLRAQRLIHEGGVSFLLIARLIPLLPFSIVCYVCGAAGVPRWRYIWTTAVGYLPLTAVFVYFGSRLESFSFRDPAFWIATTVLIVLLAATRWLGPRLTARKHESPAEG